MSTPTRPLSPHLQIYKPQLTSVLSITHRATDPAFAEELPYAVLVVALEEGPRVVGNLIGLDPSELRLDLPVQVVLDHRTDSVALVDFTPV